MSNQYAPQFTLFLPVPWFHRLPQTLLHVLSSTAVNTSAGVCFPPPPLPLPSLSHARIPPFLSFLSFLSFYIRDSP